MADSVDDTTDPATAAPAPVGVAVTSPREEKGKADPPANVRPNSARQMLSILVPIQVTLASQRKSIQEITELGPGSIVKFEKTCDEPLELCLGDRVIATGEVVKVGDKFGLRIGQRK